MSSQPQLIDGLKPSLFSLRNSRVTVGFLFQSNITFENEGTSKATPIVQVFTGELPEGDAKFDFESIQIPYNSLGLSLDWFSPNSRIGLSLSSEYNASSFSIVNANEKFEYQSNSLLIPAYLRYKFGSIHGKNSGGGRENYFLSLGPYLSLPLGLSRTINGDKEILANIQQVTYGLSMIFGTIIRLSKEAAKSQLEEQRNKALSEGKTLSQVSKYYSESPRFWVFLRADHLLTDQFDQITSDQVIPNSTNPFEYKTTNITFGIAYFFGGKLSKLE